MAPRPATPTGLTVDGRLLTTVLRWQPIRVATVVDHYRVHGVPADRADRAFQRGPGDDTLLAKRVYPFFAHTGLAPAGEEWTYVIVAVDAAGARSKPSAPVSAASKPSVTVGREVVRLGDFDLRTTGLRFAPGGYKDLAKAYGADGKITLDADATAADLPYLLPGPGDAWAGNIAYQLTWTLPVTDAVESAALALWLVDTTGLGGTLDVKLGPTRRSLELPVGSTRGSREGDATAAGSPLKPVPFEFDLEPGSITPGAQLELTLSAGGWIAWDAIGVFARA